MTKRRVELIRKFLAVYYSLWLLIFQLLPAKAFLWPATVQANQERVNLQYQTSDSIAVSFDKQTNSLIVTRDENQPEDDITVVYQREQKDSDQPIEESVASTTNSQIYLGTCSSQDCVPHQLLSGQVFFDQLDPPQMREFVL